MVRYAHAIISQAMSIAEFAIVREKASARKRLSFSWRWSDNSEVTVECSFGRSKQSDSGRCVPIALFGDNGYGFYVKLKYALCCR